MSSPHTDSTVYPTVAAPHETLEPAVLHDHLLKVCGRAHDTTDARTIAQILGLIPSPPPTNPQRRKH